MRDAFGGTFLLEVFFVFILIYIGFISISVNYAKAFKVKDRVIDYIENNDILSLDSPNANESKEMQEFFQSEIIGKYNYKSTASCRGTEVYCKDGIKIEKVGEGTNTKGEYYKVTTYFGWSLPFLNNLLIFGNNEKKDTPIGIWAITGETKLIVKG